MANEITVTAALSVYKSSVMSSTVGRSVDGATFTMTGSPFIGPTTISVGTSAEAIPLAEVTQPHWAWFKNLDATNFVEIRNGSGGADLIRLYPGEACAVPLAIDATPYAIADTAACLMEYAIFSK